MRKGHRDLQMMYSLGFERGIIGSKFVKAIILIVLGVWNFKFTCIERDAAKWVLFLDF